MCPKVQYKYVCYLLLAVMARTTDLYLFVHCCFWRIFTATLVTIFTVVFTYFTSTAATTGPADYSSLIALRPRSGTPVNPPPLGVGDRLRTLGVWAPCHPLWSRESCLRLARRRGSRAYLLTLNVRLVTWHQRLRACIRAGGRHFEHMMLRLTYYTFVDFRGNNCQSFL